MHIDKISQNCRSGRTLAVQGHLVTISGAKKEKPTDVGEGARMILRRAKSSSFLMKNVENSGYLALLFLKNVNCSAIAGEFDEPELEGKQLL